jgi:diguanylate cyclase (GGDEF)-like protein
LQPATPKRIEHLLLATLLAAVLVLAGVLAGFSWYVTQQTGQLQRQTEASLFEGARAELQTAYAYLDELLQVERPRLKAVHATALDWMDREGLDGDLGELQTLLMGELGYPVDVYLIGPELAVEHATYADDIGLDFTRPALIDGRTMIERAHETGAIVMQPPVLQIGSREFRLFTYSPWGEDGWTLELGFVSPTLNTFFRDMDMRLAGRDAYSAQLHFLMWDRYVLALQPDQNQDAQRQDEQLERLRAARDQDEPVRVRAEDGSNRYYVHLMGIPAGDRYKMHVVAEVDMHADQVAATGAALLRGASLSALLVLTGALAVFLLARKGIARPLEKAAGAIQHWEPVPLRGLAAHVREFQLLASHYNTLLEQARSRIQGLDLQTRTDSLTGLINRTGLESELELQIRHSERYRKPFSVILMDLDRFKEINDRDGHLAGDRMLRELTELLRSRVRKADSLGRWGGDEFLVICRETKLEAAARLAEALCWSISETLFLGKERCTASFGVTAYRAGDTVNRLFARVDATLYTAKQAGRNCIDVQ